jgi:hypothetical protein
MLIASPEVLALPSTINLIASLIHGYAGGDMVSLEYSHTVLATFDLVTEMPILRNSS